MTIQGCLLVPVLYAVRGVIILYQGLHTCVHCVRVAVIWLVVEGALVRSALTVKGSALNGRKDPSGEVPELADGHDLGSCAARRRGSSPRFPIPDLT